MLESDELEFRKCKRDMFHVWDISLKFSYLFSIYFFSMYKRTTAETEGEVVSVWLV